MQAIHPIRFEVWRAKPGQALTAFRRIDVTEKREGIRVRGVESLRTLALLGYGLAYQQKSIADHLAAHEAYLRVEKDERGIARFSGDFRRLWARIPSDEYRAINHIVQEAKANAHYVHQNPIFSFKTRQLHHVVDDVWSVSAHQKTHSPRAEDGSFLHTGTSALAYSFDLLLGYAGDYFSLALPEDWVARAEKSAPWKKWPARWKIARQIAPLRSTILETYGKESLPAPRPIRDFLTHFMTSRLGPVEGPAFFACRGPAVYENRAAASSGFVRLEHQVNRPLVHFEYRLPEESFDPTRIGAFASARARFLDSLLGTDRELEGV